MLPEGQELASISQHNGKDLRQQLKQPAPEKTRHIHLQLSGEKNYQIQVKIKRRSLK